MTATTTLTRYQRSGLAECGHTDEREFSDALARGEEPCVTLTPNGREVRLVVGGFAVQPRNDNYWITCRKVRQVIKAW